MERKYYSVVYYDLFASMFVTEKDPYAAPERYMEIKREQVETLILAERHKEKARVLSADEAHNLEAGKEVWLDYIGHHNWLFKVKIRRARKKDKRMGMTFTNHHPCLWENYAVRPTGRESLGWSWRIWTDRPTEKQRREMQ